MIQQPKEQVLSRVKRSFLRMASPFEFGGDEVRFDTVLSMNVPPMLARADAAYERSVELLKMNVFSGSLEARLALYRAVCELLNEASSQYTESERICHCEKKRILFQAVGVYFNLMSDQADLLYHTLEASGKCESAEKSLSTLFGLKTRETLRAADPVFSEGEIQVFHLLTDLAETAEQPLKKQHEANMRMLSKNDLARYAKAYADYKIVFADKYESAAFRQSED